MLWESLDRLPCHRMYRYVVVAEQINEVMCRRSDFPQVLPQPNLKFPEVNRSLLISMDLSLGFQVIIYSNHKTLPTPVYLL